MSVHVNYQQHFYTRAHPCMKPLCKDDFTFPIINAGNLLTLFAAISFRIMNPLHSDYRLLSWTPCVNIVTNIDNDTRAHNLWPEKCPTMPSPVLLIYPKE